MRFITHYIHIITCVSKPGFPEYEHLKCYTYLELRLDLIKYNIPNAQTAGKQTESVKVEARFNPLHTSLNCDVFCLLCMHFTENTRL